MRMRLLVVSASPRAASVSRKLARLAYDHAVRRHGAHEADFLDLHAARVQPFHGFEEPYDDATEDALQRLLACDGLFLTTPVYNGSYASSLKNLLEFVPHKRLAGRVAALAVSGGGERGLMQTRSDLDSLLSYFLVHVVPRPVFATRADLEAGVPEDVARRLRDLVDEWVQATVALRGPEAEAKAGATAEAKGAQGRPGRAAGP